MSNNVALFAGGNQISIKDADKMAAALRSSSAEGSTSQLPDGGVYISFSGKMGTYKIGEEGKDADPEEVWLVNIYMFERGWICWKGGSPAAKRMASIYHAAVATPNFDEHGPFNSQRGEGWFAAKAMTLKSIDSGAQGYFNTSTKSAVNEFSKLEAEVARRLEAGEPCWPIVMLHKEKFTAQGQTNYKPILKVYGWIGHPQVGKMANYANFADIGNDLDALIKEAADMAAQGKLTASFDDPDAGTDEPDPLDDFVAEEEEEDVKAPQTDVVNDTPPRRRAAPDTASANTAPAGGLRRRSAQ